MCREVHSVETDELQPNGNFSTTLSMHRRKNSDFSIIKHLQLILSFINYSPIDNNYIN